MSGVGHRNPEGLGPHRRWYKLLAMREENFMLRITCIACKMTRRVEQVSDHYLGIARIAGNNLGINGDGGVLCVAMSLLDFGSEKWSS